MVRTAGARLLVAALAVLVLVTGAVFLVNRAFDDRVEAIPRIDVAGLAPQTGSAQNFLILGSDTRDFVGDDVVAQEAFGDRGDAGGNRSDTIMVVHADPANETGFVVSIPRDLWVEIPGQGGSKINAAYNDGPSRVVETITTNLGVPIHHFLELDFAGFAGLVDALGGVPIYFPAPARDEVSGLEVLEAPACVVLGGDDALAYVRARSYEELVEGEWQTDPTADIGRIGRQQTFMRRLASATIRTATNDPLRADDIADATLAFLTADRALSPDDVRDLLNAFRVVNPDDPASLEMVTLPWTTGPSQGGQSVLYLDEDPAAEVLARLRDPGSRRATPTASVDPSSVRVRVLNGTDTGGLAAGTLDALVAQGFAAAGIGDAPDKPRATTEVRHRPGARAQGETVAAYLGGAGRLVEDSSVTDADVVVVVGTDFAAVVPPATAAPVPATDAAPPPDPGTAGEEAPVAAPEC